MTPNLNPWQWLRFAAAAATFLMMTVSVIDVVGRKFVGKPLRGSVELIEVLMLVTVFLAWPLVTRKRAHITLDLVDNLMPPGVQALRERLGELVGCLLMFGTAFLAYSRASQALRESETTTLLLIPLAPLYYSVAALFVLTGATHLVLAFRRSQVRSGSDKVAGKELG